MTSVSGITDFLNQAGTQFKVFDMGRRIQELDKDRFLAFEQSEQPYPWPLQQQAWLGMMVWNEASSDDVGVVHRNQRADSTVRRGSKGSCIHMQQRFTVGDSDAAVAAQQAIPFVTASRHFRFQIGLPG